VHTHLYGKQGIDCRQLATNAPNALLDNKAYNLIQNQRTSAIGEDLSQPIGLSQQTALHNNDVGTPNTVSPQTTNNVIQNQYP
jgi:hypothetical protein